jgi:hypothetical protein
MKKQTIAIALAVLAAVCGAGFAGAMAVKTFSHTGDEAASQMTKEEQEWLGRIGRLHKAMPVAKVYELLGEPTSEVLSLAKWDGFAGSKLGQLRVYFTDGHPRRVRWLKLGYFVYEKDL